MEEKKNSEFTVHTEGMRDEYWVAPVNPITQGVRQWRADYDTAIADAKDYAIKFDAAYEVYQRVALIRKD